MPSPPSRRKSYGLCTTTKPGLENSTGISDAVTDSTSWNLHNCLPASWAACSGVVPLLLCAAMAKGAGCENQFPREFPRHALAGALAALLSLMEVWRASALVLPCTGGPVVCLFWLQGATCRCWIVQRKSSAHLSRPTADSQRTWNNAQQGTGGVEKGCRQSGETSRRLSSKKIGHAGNRTPDLINANDACYHCTTRPSMLRVTYFELLMHAIFRESGCVRRSAKSLPHSNTSSKWHLRRTCQPQAPQLHPTGHITVSTPQQPRPTSCALHVAPCCRQPQLARGRHRRQRLCVAAARSAHPALPPQGHGSSKAQPQNSPRGERGQRGIKCSCRACANAHSAARLFAKLQPSRQRRPRQER